MKLDVVLVILLILVVVVAAWTRPWQERPHPDRDKVMDFVKRVGDSLVGFNKDNGFYPSTDAPKSFVYYLLHEGPNAPYLDFTKQKLEKILNTPGGEDSIDNYVEILDPYGKPLKYRYPTYPRLFDLYSFGADGMDDGGTFDDVSYLPPHFDKSFWNKERITGWKLLALTGLAVLVRLAMLAFRKNKGVDEEEEEIEKE